MTPRVPSKHQRARRHRIGVLVGQLSPFELSVALEVFGLERPEALEIRYDLLTIGADAGAPIQSGALNFVPDHGLDIIEHCDTLVVPGWRTRGDSDLRVLHAIRRARAGGVRLVSFCSGSFLLAEAGVLDGRSATTHWIYADAFKDRFPQVTLREDELYVCEPGVYTSAGSAAAIDLSLHIVREDYGAAAANHIARRLVSFPARQGGQAQFIERALPTGSREGSFSELLPALYDRLDEPLTITALAKDAGMSRRTFIRRFEAATGEAPGRWIAEQRVRRAQTLLEETRLSVDAIALRCGFGTTGGFRSRFIAKVGISPRLYRARFSAVHMA